MFSKKVCIVTGGGSGIGMALCDLLLKSGAIVFIAGNNQEQNQEAHEKFSHIYPNEECFPLFLEVQIFESYSRAINTVISKYGRVDYLFNNAGITLMGEFQNLKYEQSAQVIDINLKGVINGIHAVYPSMIEQKSGHIVNTASLAGFTGYPTSSVYAATKAGLIALGRSMRLEAEAFDVKVSTICPGYVDTPIFREDRVIGRDVDAVIQDLPFKMISAEKAASEILKGVVKNREMIIFPLYAKLVAQFSKCCSFLLALSYRKVLKAFRGS